MKFIVFNVVVAAALVFLVANKDGAIDMSLPKLGDVTAAAETAFDRVVPPVKQAPVIVDAPVIADADLMTRLVVPEPPEAVTPPPLPPVPVVEVPLREAHVVTVPPLKSTPLDLTVAQRRAEVLGEVSVASPELLQKTADRRRQLLDLAEEMEYLAAEFSVQ